LRNDLLSKDTLLSAYNKLDFIKSSMSVSVLQASINNIGTISKLSFSVPLTLAPSLFLPSSESNIKKYDQAGSSSKGANPQAPRSSGVPAAADSAPRPPGGIPEGQRIFELVNSKFRALDDLVYVLKKRILSLETNEELADAVKQFGNVGELLEDNKRLRVENQKLRAREQRFLADPLLRRRQLNTMSREQLQTLIICLQNELSASRNVLERHTVKQVAQVSMLSQTTPRAACTVLQRYSCAVSDFATGNGCVW
jgi:regulator of replication initiation timing